MEALIPAIIGLYIQGSRRIQGLDAQRKGESILNERPDFSVYSFRYHFFFPIFESSLSVIIPLMFGESIVFQP